MMAEKNVFKRKKRQAAIVYKTLFLNISSFKFASKASMY